MYAYQTLESSKIRKEFERDGGDKNSYYFQVTGLDDIYRVVQRGVDEKEVDVIIITEYFRKMRNFLDQSMKME